MKMSSSVSEINKHLFVDNCGCQVLGPGRGNLKMHGWFTYHILYITEGAGNATIDGKRIELPAGSLVFYLPGEYREYDLYRNSRSKSYYVFFSGDACEEIVRELKLGGRNVYDVGPDMQLIKLFEGLGNEYSQKNEHYEFMCQSYLLAILTSIARNISEEPRQPSELRRRINEVCRYMYENCEKIETISSLAQICHLSESRFSHLFSEITGTSPKNYLVRVRIEKAKEMLMNTDLSVGRISEAVGLHDQNYFSRVFKRFTNMSPTEYREGLIEQIH